jgi:hypothetical protein
MIHWVDQQFANWKSSFIKSYVIYLHGPLDVLVRNQQTWIGGQKRELTGNDYFPVEKGIAIPLAQWFPIEQVI